MFKSFYKPTVRNYFKARGKLEKMSLNYPIQGTSAEITKFAAIKFFKRCSELGILDIVKICNIVHDEIVVECPKEYSDSVALMLQECMEEAGKPFCKIIPLKAQPWVGLYWNH